MTQVSSAGVRAAQDVFAGTGRDEGPGLPGAGARPQPGAGAAGAQGAAGTGRGWGPGGLDATLRGCRARCAEQIGAEGDGAAGGRPGQRFPQGQRERPGRARRRVSPGVGQRVPRPALANGQALCAPDTRWEQL